MDNKTQLKRYFVACLVLSSGLCVGVYFAIRDVQTLPSSGFTLQSQQTFHPPSGSYNVTWGKPGIRQADTRPENSSARLQPTGKKPLCSFEFIRKYSEQHNALPWNFTWNMRPAPFFYPSDCSLDFQTTLPKDYIRQCFRRKGITSIVAVGDSNGMRNSKGLVKLISKCKLVIAEHISGNPEMPDKQFFVKIGQGQWWTKNLETSKRNCSGCTSDKYTCDMGSATAVNYYHFAMTSIRDNSTAVRDRATQTYYNTQETFFKFLTEATKPQLIVFFTPYSHMQENSFKSVRDELELIRQMIHEYISHPVQVLFIPGFAQNENARLKGGGRRFYNRRVDGLLANERIQAMNQIWTDVFRADLLKENSTVYSVMDLFPVSNAVGDEWCLDGVHMKPIWYDVQASVILQTLCNSK